MKGNKKNLIPALLAALPLVFTLLFFGYLHPSFDLVIYTDNIVGEGTCSAYMSSTGQTFAYLYKADAYFGSELKTLRMQDLRFDVDSVTLSLYGIEEADIVSYDIGVFGFAVLHHSVAGDRTILRPLARTAIETAEKPLTHIVNADPESELNVNFVNSIGIPTWVWIAYFAVLLLLSALLAFGLAALFARWPALRLPFLGGAAILAVMILGCAVCGSLPYVNYTDFILNWLLLFAASLALNALTLPWIGSVGVSLFTLIWYVADYFVINFRNKPIMPADLRAAGTAKEVVGGYDLTPTGWMIAAAVITAGYIAVMIVLWARPRWEEKKPLKRRLLGRAAALVVAALLLLFGVNNPAFNRLNEFQWDAKVLEGFHREGIVLTYVKSAMSAHVSRPEGYSREAVAAYLEEYRQAPQTPTDGVRPTRIIMVMNEAFSDLRTVGMDPRIDVMPYIDSLEENTIQGSLYVSVIGGGTCNTEFEALTGNSLAFMGSGAYPYTENVTKAMFSLASYFRDNGYLTEAFHANEADNWNRDRVYPNFGFGEFNSIEDYPELYYLHRYVTDESDYAFIRAEDAAHADRPRFLFNVTIQNHADYDHFLDVMEAESVRENGSQLDEPARVYLSLIKASDDAIRELVETYRDSDEPTMIVFFGDHQPYLGINTMNQLYTAVYSQLDYFKSKLFIWTNYETQPVGNLGISANYLPWLILERGNFPLPPYVRMLKELYEAYPVVTSQGVISSEGELYDNVAECYDDPLIRKYQYVQYANLFDELDPAWFAVE